MDKILPAGQNKAILRLKIRQGGVKTARYVVVDVARGCALSMMIIYHFSFDLNLIAGLGIDFSRDLRWVGFRALIVTLFLLLVGVSQSLASRHGLDGERYLKRLGWLLACAGLITLTSRMIFPDVYIFFGILHFIAVASILGLLTLSLYRLNLVLGLTLIVIGVRVAHPWFDQAGLQWVGLMTHKPLTQDYVPLLPWFGVVLIGQFLGRWLAQTPEGMMNRNNPRSLHSLLTWGGRHSLLLYMAHQPLLFGLLYLYFRLRAQ